MARPSKLDNEMILLIKKSVRDGNFITTACAANGITRDCYYKWLERGKESEKDKKYDDIYYQFLYAIKKAEGQAEEDLISELRKGDLGWQSKAWMLERRFRSKYGKEIQVSEDTQIDINLEFYVDSSRPEEETSTADK